MHESQKAGEMEVENRLSIAFFTLFYRLITNILPIYQKLLSGFRLMGVFLQSETRLKSEFFIVIKSCSEVLKYRLNTILSYN